MPHIASTDKTPFKPRWFSTDQLVQMGSIPIAVRDAVVAAILERRNILVSGGIASGKSTLLKAFADRIPDDERTIVIEHPTEFPPSQNNWLRWEAFEEMSCRRGHITVASLIRAAVRHRPDRIVIGEVRDRAAFEILQAANTGRSALLTTVHAHNARHALDRISDLALSARSDSDRDSVRSQTAEAFHYVLHTDRDRQGERRVAEFVKVTGYSRELHEFQFETLYRFHADIHRASAGAALSPTD